MFNTSPPTPSYNCDIFIRSHAKDFPWLLYCLQSIHKYCRGFRKLILVVPESDRKKTGPLFPYVSHIYFSPNYKHDYLGQQVTKLYADQYTDADAICHVDSDCIFHRELTPAHFIEESKMKIFIKPYANLSPNFPWRAAAEHFFKRNIKYDFMPRQPLVYPRWAYAKLREFCVASYGLNVSSYILSQPPRGFSEYNVLGAYLYFYHHQKFCWRNTSAPDSELPFCKWYWSWGGITKTIKDEIQGFLKDEAYP